jgi:protein gp37
MKAGDIVTFKEIKAEDLDKEGRIPAFKVLEDRDSRVLVQDIIYPDLIEPRARLCKLIEATPWLTWLLLTKRIENAYRLTPPNWHYGSNSDGAPRNVWIGVTTEDQKTYNKRIGPLMYLKPTMNVSKIWLSIEPQIGPIDLRSSYGLKVDWAIVGGESGAGCRPFDVEWARSIKAQCHEMGTAFFLKQLGGNPDKRHNMNQFPEDLRVREFPK